MLIIHNSTFFTYWNKFNEYDDRAHDFERWMSHANIVNKLECSVIVTLCQTKMSKYCKEENGGLHYQTKHSCISCCYCQKKTNQTDTVCVIHANSLLFMANHENCKWFLNTCAYHEGGSWTCAGCVNATYRF